MRTMTILLTLQLFCATGLFAWQDYDQFYNEHKNETGVLSFRIPTDLLKVFVDEDEDLDGILNKVDQVSFFISDERAVELMKDLRANLSEGTYKDMIEMKDGGSTIRLKAKEAADGLEELIISVEDEDSLFVLCVKGVFSFEDARRFTKSINTERMREQAK